MIAATLKASSIIKAFIIYSNHCHSLGWSFLLQQIKSGSLFMKFSFFVLRFNRALSVGSLPKWPHDSRQSPKPGTGHSVSHMGGRHPVLGPSLLRPGGCTNREEAEH